MSRFQTLITVRPDEQQYRRLNELFERFPREVPKVTARAANRTATKVRTLILRAITKTINVKRKDITGHMHTFGGVTVRKATWSHPVALVRVTGRRIPLYRFGARAKAKRNVRMSDLRTRRRIKRRVSGGVYYRIRRGQARRLLVGAFIATMRTGHVGVFKRKSPSVRRLPIIELRGPSIPHVAEQSGELKRALKMDLSDLFMQRLDHEIGRVLERKKGGK
ncbi:MAG: phage tail protein [Phycisphaerae bacterium]|nr:phage tail protein [Phycisphaerae bacterium]